MGGDGPEWLPELARFTGDWQPYEDELYRLYQQDFPRNAMPTFNGKRLGLKRYPEYKNKDGTFWHLTSEGKSESDRVPDLRRCERIRWPRAMVDAANTDGIDGDRVKVWSNDRIRPGGTEETRWVLSLPDYGYIFVIADRGTYCLPWTAYLVEREHTQRKLASEHQAYVKATKG